MDPSDRIAREFDRLVDLGRAAVGTRPFATVLVAQQAVQPDVCRVWVCGTIQRSLARHNAG
jgi:hypothetical protein